MTHIIRYPDIVKKKSANLLKENFQTLEIAKDNISL